LRDYGEDEQLGMEDTPEEYVANLVQVFGEVKRVLRDDGTVWLNLGDSYASNQSSGDRVTGYSSFQASNKGKFGGRQVVPPTLKAKDLVGIPWRVAFALQQDGWYLRQDIIWHKPNPMPESVTDRCTKAHEYIFLLSKNAKYYYDHEAIREDCEGIDERQWAEEYEAVGSVLQGESNAEIKRTKRYNKDGSFKRNKRSVWTVTTKPYKEAHFATFPMDLIEPCVLAGCPEGGTVLDPFGGSGTTGQIADGHNRNAILCELNPEYIEISKKRLGVGTDLFSEVEVKNERK
jgi:DNA modification methylase